MAEHKRRRRSEVEAEARELASEKKGNGQEPGSASTSKVLAQMDEHEKTTNKKYHEGLGRALVEYFATAVPWWTNYNDAGTGKVLPKGTVPTFERFAFSKGFSKFSYYNWCNNYPEFALAYAEAQELQKAFILEGAAAGAIPANFAIFMLKCNHGMLEPQSGSDDGDTDDVNMVIHGEGQKK